MKKLLLVLVFLLIISIAYAQQDTLMGFHVTIKNATNGSAITNGDVQINVSELGNCAGNLYNTTYVSNISSDGILDVLVGDFDTIGLEYNRDYYLCVNIQNRNTGPFRFRTIGEIGPEDVNFDVGNLSWNKSYAEDLFYLQTNLSATTLDHTSGADYIGIPVLNGASYESVHEALNLFNSAGRITGGAITEGAGSTIEVSAGTGFIKATDSDIAELMSFDWDADVGFTVETDSIMYYGIDYNEGTPIITNMTTDTWDLDTQFPLGSVINQHGELYILNNPWWVGDGLTNIIERIESQGHIVRDAEVGGLILGSTGTRNPTMTAGKLWSRLTEYEIPEFDSSDTDTFDYYYRDAGGGYDEFSDQTQWNITHWDDGTGTLNDLGNNQYAVIWVWINVASEKISLMYPQAEYPNPSSAEAEEIPEFPAMWYQGGIIIGRIIIQEGQDAPIEIQSAFTQTFTASQSTDHGNLAGLSDDDHKQYLLINGTRAMTGNLTLKDKITFVFEEFIDNLEDGWIRINGNFNVTGNSTFNNISAEYYYGDGSHLKNISSYNTTYDARTDTNVSSICGDDEILLGNDTLSCVNFYSYLGGSGGNPFDQFLNKSLGVLFREVNVSENIYIGDSEGDHYVYFYEDGSPTGEHMKWDNAGDRFEFSDALTVSSLISLAGIYSASAIYTISDIYTTGIGDDLWLGSTTQADAKFQAFANGNLSIQNLTVNGLSILTNSTDINISSGGKNICIGNC